MATARPTMQPSCCDATAAYLSNSFSASICDDVKVARDDAISGANLEAKNLQNHGVVITVRVVEQEGCTVCIVFCS